VPAGVEPMGAASNPALGKPTKQMFSRTEEIQGRWCDLTGVGCKIP
jgi:hypothetical protein